MILAKVQLGRLPALIRQAPEIARPAMTQFLRDSARTLISSSGKVPGLVQVTPPHSQGVRGAEARKQGENATAGDIAEVYATPGKVFNLIKQAAGIKEANRYWYLHKNHPEKARFYLENDAPGIVRGLNKGFDDGQEHMRRRDRRGRIRGRASVLVTSPEIGALRAYIRRRQRNVGLLAAAIPAAYNGRFGPLRGVPAWVRRHTASWASGFVSERKNSRGSTISVGINAGPFERELQRRFNYVLAYRLAAMKRQLPYITRSIQQKIRLR